MVFWFTPRHPKIPFHTPVERFCFAVAEVHSFVSRVYAFIRLLFPALPEERAVHLIPSGNKSVKHFFSFISNYLFGRTVRQWPTRITGRRFCKYSPSARSFATSLPTALYPLRSSQSKGGRSLLGATAEMEIDRRTRR